MGSWTDILNEISSANNDSDSVRRKYLKQLSGYTGRNTIAYYSGWLQKNPAGSEKYLSINDDDINGFMTVIHMLDTREGLDLILHTPGGGVAATEAIINYLTKKFNDIRVIVPQLAMSGGTMIACSANRIVMGKQSSLGPIDPLINGVPAHGILEDFEQASREIKADPTKIYIWNPILSKYNPGDVSECQRAIEWSKDIARRALEARMLRNETEQSAVIEKIIGELANSSNTLSHSRHLPAERCSELGLVVDKLEDDQGLQDAVLTVHHAYMCTLSLTITTACKIIENHLGLAYVRHLPIQKI